MNPALKESKNYIDLDIRLVDLMKDWVLRHIVEEDVKHCSSGLMQAMDTPSVEDRPGEAANKA